jgi:hypothetical protein
MLQIPQIEHFAPVDQLLRAHQLQHLLAQHQRRDYRLVLFQQRARLEHLEARRRDQLFQDRAVEYGAAAHRVGLDPHQVVFEKAEEKVVQERPEIRHQPLARLDQFADRRRGQPEFRPCPPVVAVALDPRRIVGDCRDIDLTGFDGFAFARHRGFPSGERSHDAQFIC